MRAARGGRRDAVLLLAGLLLVALNLRFALTSIGPLIDDVRADLGLSGATSGLLTTAPLLALGLVSPLAPRLAARFGAEHVVLACMLAIGAGVLLRWLPPVGLLFAGSLVAGCAIAVGNVLMPGIVKRRYGDRAATMTGIYSVGLGAGAAIAAGLSVPVEQWLDGDWRLALALWALPAALAAVAWAPQLAHRGREQAQRVEAERAATASGAIGADTLADDGPVSLWSDRRAWSVTAFMGLQSLIFYSAVAWLPEVLRDQGLSSSAAGATLSFMLLLGIPSSIAVAALAGRLPDQRPLAAVAAVLPALGWIGLLSTPGSATIVWAALIGIGAGTGFTLALTLFVLRARDARHTAALSGMAQSVGYTVAALGPFAIGGLHDLSGSWSLSLGVLACLGAPELIVALAAARRGYVGAPPRALVAA